MASTQHKDLVGPDLHVTKIDPTTGTELTPPSLVILDTRYINEGQVAGGDLSGTFPNPTVVWANAYPTLDGRYYTEAETNALIAAILFFVMLKMH